MRRCLNDPAYVRASASLDDIELFDASFFGVNHREAEMMDPQHRIFLECAWEALENAGYDAETYHERIGVYAGHGLTSYLLSNLYSNRQSIWAISGSHSLLGNDKDYLSTRVSYKLNLNGPSLTVQTACSTSARRGASCVSESSQW
jgi:acyl transferase domain-containing protein